MAELSARVNEGRHVRECLRLENKNERVSDSAADHRVSKKVSVEASPSALIETCTAHYEEMFENKSSNKALFKALPCQI